MASAILSQLSVYGPDRCEALSESQAAEYTRQLVRTQYENFTVVSRLLPGPMRPHFANIYAFCRWADDLGDETGDRGESLRLLDWWREELAACYAGKPRHPVYVALGPTIRRFDIPQKPFDDLIDAFVQDQSVLRYQSWEQVVDYCTRSANPVGRLVLYLCGHRDDRRQALSDETCTALQLVNFWQDVRRDIIERDRIYAPLDVLGKHGMTHERMVEAVKGGRELSAAEDAGMRGAIRELVDETWPLFQRGRGLLGMISGPMRVNIELFSLGGESIMRMIEKINYDTIHVRPRLSKGAKLMLMGRALWGKARCMLGGGGK